MMKQSDKFENNIIDNYYNENQQLDNQHDVSDEGNIQNYKENFQASMNTMNLLNGFDFELEINIMEIIEKAEKIKMQRKFRYELLGFIVTCILILSSIAGLAISINPKLLIYLEILFSALLPLTLIPISKNSKVKEEV